MIPKEFFSPDIDPVADRFGVFTPQRDAAGKIVDFRIDYLSFIPCVDDNGVANAIIGSELLSVAPALESSALFDRLAHLMESGEPLHDVFSVDGADQYPPRRLDLHGVRVVEAVVLHWHDVGEQAKSADALERRVAERTAQAEARSDQLRHLALALADAEARERKRLAQVLHDHFQQLLSAAKLKAGLVRRLATETSVQDGVRQVENLLEEAITESRSLTAELSPPLLYDAGLHAALEAMARNFQPRHGLKVTLYAEPNSEPADEKMRVLLYEVIRELLQNVVQHAGASAATVQTMALPGGLIQVLVSDDGRGFDVETTLAQVNRTGSSALGMLEIRERLKFLGGDLFVDSSPGQGTRVRAVVPAELLKAQSASLPIEQSRAAPQSSRQPPLYPAAPARNGPARVLVADDHAIFREGLVALLAQEPSLKVIAEAADGEQAIALARTHRPDIILLDINMPKISGVEVARLLSQEIPTTRIVGLSMHQREDMAEAMQAAGAVAYVTKADASETLLGVLRGILNTGAQK